MQNLGDSLNAFRRTGLALPNESQCATCGYFDISHPDVQRILRARDPRGVIFVEARCKCRAAAAAASSREQLRRIQANLPHPANPRTFANFRARAGTEELLEAATQFANRQGPRILALCGPPGGGKSHLLEAIGRAALDQERTARYEFTSSFLDRLRHCYDYDSDDDLYHLMGWYQGFDTLLLDDLGVQRSTPWAMEKLTEVVDERLRNQRRMVIATNLSPEQMAQNAGERLASRIFQENRQLGEVTVVVVTAPDYRRAA